MSNCFVLIQMYCSLAFADSGIAVGEQQSRILTNFNFNLSHINMVCTHRQR